MMKNLVRAACVVLLSTTPAAAATITFEDVAVASGTDVLSGDVVSGGFVFDSSGDHLHRVNGADVVVSGSTALGIHEFPGFDNIVTIRPQAGGVFSLNSFDVAEFIFRGNTQIHITGVGGTNPVLDFVLDGFGDGSGGLPDSQTVIFGPEWSNLTAVVLNGIGGPLDVNGAPLGSFALDNVVVNSTVPEPASLLLMATGLAMTVRRRLRRR